MWVIKTHQVAFCLAQLRKQRIHSTFNGYLCIKRTSKREGRNDDLQVNFREYFESFLRVKDCPIEEKPYVRTFWESPLTTDDTRWLTSNVAGMYAPSSLRPNSPLRKVVRVDGERQDTLYSLRHEHWKLARMHLLYNQKISLVALSVFFLRDYAFARPLLSDIVGAFKAEFGYLVADAQKELMDLYDDESGNLDNETWFEPMEEG